MAAVEGRPERPSLRRILRVWLAISVQSFGGGVATLALIRAAAVDHERWVSDSEFTRLFALCQMTPGINLLSLTILLGRKTRGAAGIATAVTGLLIPSVTLTILMTAIYARFREVRLVKSALNGLLPATLGLGILTAWQLAVPLARTAVREGGTEIAVSAAILVASGAAVAVWHLPVVAVLLVAGSVSALHAWLRSLGSSGAPTQ